MTTNLKYVLFLVLTLFLGVSTYAEMEIFEDTVIDYYVEGPLLTYSGNILFTGDAVLSHPVYPEDGYLFVFPGSTVRIEKLIMTGCINGGTEPSTGETSDITIVGSDFKYVEKASDSSYLYNNWPTEDYAGWIDATGDSLEHTDYYVSGKYADGTWFCMPVSTPVLKLEWLNAVEEQPAIDVAPASYDFGMIAIDEFDTTTVTISNTGEAALTVTALPVAGASGEFSIVSAPDVPFMVDPNSTVEIEVAYTPAVEGQAEGFLWVYSNDPNIAELVVPLTGFGVLVEPNIDVSPVVHDFGDIEIATEATVVSTISNYGNAPLNLSDIVLTTETGEFAITDAPQTPCVVEPNATVDIELTFTPAADGYTESTVLIYSDDPDDPAIQIDLGGVGVAVELEPNEQMQAILDSFNQAVSDGSIVGNGKNSRCAQMRLRAFKHMLRSASTLINADYYRWAKLQLRVISKKSDGKKRPPDFVKGDGVAELNAMIDELIEALN